VDTYSLPDYFSTWYRNKVYGYNGYIGYTPDLRGGILSPDFGHITLSLANPTD